MCKVNSQIDKKKKKRWYVELTNYFYIENDKQHNWSAEWHKKNHYKTYLSIVKVTSNAK